MTARGCTASGVVTAAAAGFIDVEFEPPPRCSGCGGACFWYRFPDKQHARLGARGDLPVGAKVSVAVPDRLLLLASMLVFGLPLLALLGGAAVGAALLDSDLGAALGAVLGLFAAVLAGLSLRRRVERAALERIAIRVVE